ncbi:phytanoyl-CoA dioxygenase family protein [Kordiimonas marina]|uniref:phytanoyl-CoA dioxygenase family protein n=1 Tax=Kordiimonas marina TaxID=2872312 RepID=UPI001FF60243|nr:phytanoyl-CoA dioxygenase family protein [Kordiimonas marina]MCJ9429531.1 phytanoyl-CoA dioxygenase family protein [Kordiimonas marina]
MEIEDLNLPDHGAELWSGVLPENILEPLRAELGASSLEPDRGGLRGADLQFPGVAALARNQHLLARVGAHLPTPPRLIRAILFDKSPTRNWLVAWHQDKTVACAEKHDLPGWSNWTFKDGLHHAQPPRSVLDAMLTVRVHLDGADENNGCLKIISGSHRLGILAQADVSRHTEGAEAVLCRAQAGDILAMRPLLLHASSKALSHQPRRILHLEFGAA